MPVVITGLPGIDDALAMGRFARIRRMLQRNQKLQRKRYSAARSARRQRLEQAVLAMLPGREET